MKICEQCGETNRSGSLLCVVCGSSLKDVIARERNYSDNDVEKIEMPQYHYEESSNSGCAIALLFVATLLIPIVGL